MVQRECFLSRGPLGSYVQLQLSSISTNAPVNGMPQYPPPAPSRGILGDLTIISIAPGSEQYLKSNPLFSTKCVLGEHRGFDCIQAASVMTWQSVS